MKRKAVALIAPILFAVCSADISAAGGSRHLGHSRSSHLARSLKQSGGFHTTFGGHGSRLNPGSRHLHRHHFGHHKHFHHGKIFGPPHRLGHHHVIIPRHGLHSGFFVGHRVISVRPSPVVIWSDPGAISSYTVPPPLPIVDADGALERPLITIMLRHRDELSLSAQQVQDLENLRDGYQREAIRYQADIRTGEMDLQRLLNTDPVELEQVKVKLQKIEHLKTEIRLARIRAIEEGRALLSPEQYQKLQSLLDEYSRFEDARLSQPTEDQR
jgi:hypothetical protein